ncbi:carbonic anhydrase 12 isoform X2 [Acipenser ruthenus]|uniref:carbonic anhydrase 12 isoform X2 n=1 Tax=Acipenser ruthenus TaxID=7906 RepID=UPI0027428008|nr:carbonic anhydrase 12 isoform X2 [Acipenser ruthenus]
MSPDSGVAFLRSLFLLLVCGGGVDEIQADGPHWSYTESHGQSQWPELFPHCGGLSQSPVNIDTDCVKLDPSLRPVEPQGYSTLSSDFFTLENNGHSVQMSLPSSMSLSQRFTAVQLHLHWGSRGNGAGSEHLINWQASLAEMSELYIRLGRPSQSSLESCLELWASLSRLTSLSKAYVPLPVGTFCRTVSRHRPDSGRKNMKSPNRKWFTRPLTRKRKLSNSWNSNSLELSPLIGKMYIFFFGGGGDIRTLLLLESGQQCHYCNFTINESFSRRIYP